jgi:AcrR family transcriptional regulator
MPTQQNRLDSASAALRPPDSRDKILEVAEGLFAYGGYSGVGMRQLAATVGLSKSSLFHHFPTKLELYSAVLDRVLGRIADGLDAAATRETQPERRLEEWIDAVIRTLSEDMPAGRLMMRALVDEEPFPAVMLTAGPDAARDLIYKVPVGGHVTNKEVSN